MDTPDTSPGHDGEPDPERRMVLAALLAAYLLPLVPPANARPAGLSGMPS